MARFLAPSEPLRPGDIQLTTTPGFGVGALIRVGTLSRTNHAQTVVRVLDDGRRLVAAAYGDKRGHAIRLDGRTWAGYAVRLTDDEAEAAKIVETAVSLCGASGTAYQANDLAGALHLPGIPYGWGSIALISLRGLHATGLRWRIMDPIARWLTRLTTRRVSLICSEAVRQTIETVQGPFATQLPLCETSPADLLNLLANYSRSR